MQQLFAARVDRVASSRHRSYRLVGHVFRHLNLPIRTRAELALRGTGSACCPSTVKWFWKRSEHQLQTKQLRLNKGERSVTLEWTPPREGPAWIRLLWDGRDFTLEPIPTQQLTATEAHDNIEHGLDLIAEHRCTACHASQASTFVSDLDRPAGSLRDAGQRLHGRWVQEWLLDPSAHRADTAMPALLSGPNAEQDAADLAAWVVSMGSGTLQATQGRSEDGKVLAAKLQCLNCHVLEPEDDYDGISLAGVSQKYQPGAMADFLRAPHARSPWSQMPDFRLSEQEAADLEAFLREAVPGQGAGVTGDVVRGEELANALRCGNCHQSDAPPMPSVPLPTGTQESMEGCLGNDASSTPDFRLSDVEQTAINQTFAAQLPAPPTLAWRPVPSTASAAPPAMRVMVKELLVRDEHRMWTPPCLRILMLPKSIKRCPTSTAREKSSVPNIC